MFSKETVKINYHIFRGILTDPCPFLPPLPTQPPTQLLAVMQQDIKVLSFRNFILLFGGIQKVLSSWRGEGVLRDSFRRTASFMEHL